MGAILRGRPFFVLARARTLERPQICHWAQVVPWAVLPCPAWSARGLMCGPRVQLSSRDPGQVGERHPVGGRNTTPGDQRYPATVARTRKRKPAKTCFLLMPIDEPQSATRVRSDTVQEHIIEPAIRPLGYSEIVRADQMDKPGIITNQIVGHLLDDDLVIVDMTDLNANVFYELAVRHVSGKPVVHIIEQTEKIPFDVNPLRAIPYTLSLVEGKQAIKSIQGQVEEWERGENPIENPISRGIDVYHKMRSSEPIESQIAQLQAALEDLTSEVRQGLSGYASTFSPTVTARPLSEWLAEQPEKWRVLNRPPQPGLPRYWTASDSPDAGTIDVGTRIRKTPEPAEEG